MTHRSLCACLTVAGALVLGAAPARAQAARPVPASRAQRDTLPLLRPARTAPPPAPTARSTAVAPAVVTPVAKLAAGSPPPPAAVAFVIEPAVPRVMEPTAPPPMAGSAAAAAVARAQAADPLPPANATARCKDGTYLTGGAADAACADKGGVAVNFPPARSAQPARAKLP